MHTNKEYHATFSVWVYSLALRWSRAEVGAML
jgi:hypothetical protein